MKNLIATLLLCSISTVHAQEVNDYKYIHIPEKFSSFEQDQYQLNNRLRYLLTQKKYEVLPSDKLNWPQEILQSPCSVLSTDIHKIKSFLNNKLEVVFTDCSQNNIETFEGTSKIKEFDKGYQEALKLALMKLRTPNAKTSIPMTKLEQSKKVVNEVATPEPKSADVTISNLLTDGTKNYQKIDLQNGGFILMSENGNQVIAKFETTSKTGVYRVVVTNDNSNYSSVGYSNENSISYEVLENNIWKEVKLTAK